MDNKSKEKNILAKEALKAINRIEDSLKVENIIKDNKIEFKSGIYSYRIRKPNIAETQEIQTVKRKKYIKLVDDDTYFFRKQWIDKYKKKGIDINKMDTDIKVMQSEIESLLLRLAKTSEPKSIQTLEKNIEELRDKQYNISIEKTDLLSHSIEDQLLIFVNSYTTYLVLEKKYGNDWNRAFKSYEDFLNSTDAELINNAYSYINYLIYEGIYESKNDKKSS